jgi:AcrR family transcriptional regulator
MTTRRTYTLGRRAETAAETKQRLVEATSSLHAERGIAAVSLRDVAERAGVSVGTAYHHFPTYLEAVRACAAHHATVSVLPADSIFDGVSGVAERVAVLMRALAHWYEEHPWLERIRAERSAYEPVEESMTHLELRLRELARMAAKCTLDEARMIAALSDVAVYNSLRRAGVAPSRVPGRMTEAILAWLRTSARGRKRS